MPRSLPNGLRRRLALAWGGGCALVAATSCTDFKQGADPPEGLQCNQIILGGDTSASLAEALASAKPGACIVVGTNTYRGNFSVPQGVTIASAKGKRAVVQGTDRGKPTIALVGGSGSGLCGVAILDSAGVGITILGGPVVIKDVSIEKAADVGIATQCDADCDEAHAIDLKDVRVRQTKLGAWFRGGVVRWSGGLSSENRSTSLSGGAGIVAHDGVRFELSNVAVENNEAAGIVLDGDKGSSGLFTDVRVVNNGERGIWAQRLAARAGAPSLHVRGNSVVEKNAKVGIGIFASEGVLVEGARIADTREAPIVAGLQRAMQGDGMVFDQSGGRVQGVKLGGNARAAALIDRPTGAIEVVQATVDAPGGAYKVVVQNDEKKLAAVPAGDVSTVEKALVSTPAVNLAEYTQ